MQPKQLASHRGSITTEGGDPFSVVMEHRRNVSPSPTLRVVRQGRHGIVSSEQTSSDGPGTLELRHRAGTFLHLAGRSQHPQSDSRPLLNTVRQRLREWYKPALQKAGPQRCELDVTRCFALLLTWILKNWPQPRMALALDATSLADRLVVLSVSLVSRGTSIPIAWKVLRGNQPHAWRPEWLTLLQWLGQRIDPTWTVVVMTDRGLYAKWLFQAIVTQGWHPLMRVTRVGMFLPAGWTEPAAVLAVRAPACGASWQGRGTASPARRSAAWNAHSWPAQPRVTTMAGMS